MASPSPAVAEGEAAVAADDGVAGGLKGNAPTPAGKGLEGKIEDDGTVELAMLATEHPEILRFGKLAFEHARSTNRLSGRCAAWLESNDFPDEALDDYLVVQVTLGELHKEIERLDSIDLAALAPGWGDKATVRMSRKSLIGFAEAIMTRLEDIQGRMASPAAALKERRRDWAAKQCPAPAAAELSLEEKYGDRLRQPEPSGKPAAAPLEEGARPAPASKRPRVTSSGEVAELLQRLQARTGQELQRRPVQTYRRQLANLAALPDLERSPPLCRECVECALGAVQAALAAEPPAQVLGALLLALKRVEALLEPSGLPSVLLDLASAIEGL